MTLDQLRNNQQAIIKRLPDDYHVCVGLMEQGFIPNILISLAHRAPFNGPLAVRLQGTKIAINAEIARQIEVDLLP